MTPAACDLIVRVRKALAHFVLDMDLALPPAITVLFGASGAGKTTLLDCLAGLARPDSGTLSLGDEVWFDSARAVDLPASRRGIGYVFQDLALFPHLTAAANIGYGLVALAPDERARRVAAVAESFRIAPLLARRPGSISGVEQQRVALARTLVTRPRLLLLDEPFAGLDAPTRARLIADLRAWHAAQRIPVLLVTHTREEVFALAERVLVMEAGRIVAEGTADHALDAPLRESVAHLAGYENIFDAEVAALHPASGTMTCRLSGSPITLEAPLARLSVGDRLRLGLRAGDILLATAPPSQISARNVLRGVLAALRQQDVTVIADVDCGARFEVHVTPGARDSLQLAPGREVWLVIKTHSCRVLY